MLVVFVCVRVRVHVHVRVCACACVCVCECVYVCACMALTMYIRVVYECCVRVLVCILFCVCIWCLVASLPSLPSRVLFFFLASFFFRCMVCFTGRRFSFLALFCHLVWLFSLPFFILSRVNYLRARYCMHSHHTSKRPHDQATRKRNSKRKIHSLTVNTPRGYYQILHVSHTLVHTINHALVCARTHTHTHTHAHAHAHRHL